MEKKTPIFPRRLLIFVIFAFVLSGLVALQYAGLMIFAPVESTSEKLHFPVVERGPILDRNGRLLAFSTRLDTVTAWLPDVEQNDKPETAVYLSRILDIPTPEILRKIEGSEGFVFIKRKITPTESRRLRELKAQGLLRGINLELEFGRSYPEKSLGSQVLGYVGTDNVGLSGIEYTFNDILSPAEISDEKERVGNALYLTIDVNLQYMLEKIARNAMETHHPDAINILVMGARTGEVLGYASLPDYDPNSFSRFSEFERRNRPISLAYEPGSVFKIFSMASLLDAGAIRLTDTFPCFGYYEKILPSGEVIRIKDLEAPGLIDVQKVLAYSSNAGAGYASDRIDASGFEEHLRRFGFGQRTGIPFIGETTGIFKNHSTWSARSKPTIAMGQEIAVSAIQMISAATVFANEGQLLKPRLVRKIVGEDGQIMMEGRTEVVQQALKPETAKTVLRMLKDVISEGTGTRARIEGLEVAGKTGTAQVRDPQTGHYSEKNFIASILLFLPADQPEYLIYVTLDNPKGDSYYGGRIAAPIAKEAAEKLVQYAGIPKAGDTVLVHSGTAKLEAPPRLVLGPTMPDLRGLSKRALLPLLQRQDLSVEIRGEGWVVRQSPQPGTDLISGTRLVLELE